VKFGNKTFGDMRAPAEEAKVLLQRRVTKNFRANEGSCRGGQGFSCKGEQTKTFGDMRVPAEESKGSPAKEGNKKLSGQ
jgi:hypothetical protein